MSLDNDNVLRWQGIHDWVRLETAEGLEIPPESCIISGLHVVVISCAESVAFDLAVLASFPSIIDLTGCGCTDPGPVRSPESWLGQDLWHVDHIVRNHLLTSWAVADFPSFTVWVPSFTDAVLELWPCAVEPQLQQWLSVPESTIFAIVLETWGWNLAAFRLAGDKLITLFFEQNCRASVLPLV